jgi:hypothetical protein
VRHFYAWAPLVIVTTIVLLSLPWLGLIALTLFVLVALVALAALAWAVVFVPYTLGRAISRRWHLPAGASPRKAAGLSSARRQDDPVWQRAPSHPAALTVGRELQAPEDSFQNGHVA